MMFVMATHINIDVKLVVVMFVSELLLRAVV